MGQRIKKINLSTQLIDALTEQIESNELHPGEKIPNEIELAEFFSVSRNIMREAMKVMESFGILESKVGSGTYISENALANIHSMRFFNRLKMNTPVREVLESRLIIEPNLTYYACLRAKDSEIQALVRRAMETAEEWLRGKCPSEDFDFHLRVAKMARNEIMESLLTALLNQLKNSEYLQVNQYLVADEMEHKIKEHLQILEALKRRDAQEARSVMYQHLFERVQKIETAYNIDLAL